MALRRPIRLRSRILLLLPAAALLVLAAACSSGSSSAGANAGATAGASNNSGSTQANLTGVPTLQQMYDGLATNPPSSSPPPAKHKTVYWVSCGQADPTCALYAAEGQKAAQALGWTFKLADGALTDAGRLAATRTAVAAHPDAIVLSHFSCATVKPPLQTAKAEGILVLGLETMDCNESGDGPPLFTAPIEYNKDDLNGLTHWQSYGKTSADFIMRDSNGHAQIITGLGQADPQFDTMDQAFYNELKKCPGCQVVDKVNWTIEDLSPSGPWIPALRNALLQHPNATYLYIPFDFQWAGVGAAQAVAQSGLKIKTVGGIGDPAGMALISQGLLYASPTARPGAWMAWAAMDELNRAFNHQPAVPEGVGFTLVTKDHNLPSGSNARFEGNIDFRAAYLKAWGVSG